VLRSATAPAGVLALLLMMTAALWQSRRWQAQVLRLNRRSVLFLGCVPSRESVVFALDTAEEVSKLLKIEDSIAPNMAKLMSHEKSLTRYFNLSRQTVAEQLIVESVASLVIVVVVCCRCKCVFDSLRRSRSGNLNPDDPNGVPAAIPPHAENGRCCIISCFRPSQLPQDQRKSWTTYQWTVVFVVCTLIIRFIASVINAVTSWYALTDSCPRQPVSGKFDPCGSCQSFGALLWTWMVFTPHPHFAVILLSEPIFLVVALVCIHTSRVLEDAN
jgi:hypothetical protein